jgi:hypothetical protein
VKIGAWIHSQDDLPLGDQIRQAASHGLRSIRSYSIEYAERAAPALAATGMTLLGGLHVDSGGLLADWRSQLRLSELARYHELGVSLEAICVGNELREGGDAPGDKRFTARLSFALATLIRAYREWLHERGLATPLTYAMEGIVFDPQGDFLEFVWPLIDACDIVSLNAYPMDERAWFTYGAFEESRRFLRESRTRNDRLTRFECQLRRALQQLEEAGKPVILSETGFPSAVGYQIEGERLVVPQSDDVRFGEVMCQFLDLIRRVNADYAERIQALYFYEWRDNLHHPKIWNVEQSPIHVAFGLCDRYGTPKLDIAELVGAAEV